MVHFQFRNWTDFLCPQLADTSWRCIRSLSTYPAAEVGALCLFFWFILTLLIIYVFYGTSSSLIDHLMIFLPLPSSSSKCLFFQEKTTSSLLINYYLHYSQMCQTEVGGVGWSGIEWGRGVGGGGQWCSETHPTRHTTQLMTRCHGLIFNSWRSLWQLW